MFKFLDGQAFNIRVQSGFEFQDKHSNQLEVDQKLNLTLLHLKIIKKATKNWAHF